MSLSVRANLNVFISANLGSLPSDDVDSLSRLNGVSIAPNNFFDSGIDVDGFVEDIEVFANQIDAAFRISADVEQPEDFLRVNNSFAHSSFVVQQAQIQAQIDQILADAEPGFLTYANVKFDAFWEAGGRGIYDNMKTAVDRVGKGKQRDINVNRPGFTGE